MSRYSDWQRSGVVNRNYHILHAFAKDERINSILAVDVFPINAKRGLKYFIQDHLFGSREGEVIYGTLTSKVRRVSSKISVFSTLDNLIRPEKVLLDIKKSLSILGMSDDLIIWNCNPLYTDYLDKIPAVKKIFDAVDNWMHHSSFKNLVTVLKKNYQILLEKNDLVTTVSESLVDDLKSDHTYWIPNAVDNEHFETSIVSPRLNNIPKPHIGFLGILQDRIDVELLKNIAQEIPDASLVLAGPVWKNFPKQELEKYNNVYFTGPVSYAEIPNFYAGFNVGIIPYKNNEFIKSTNSMKFYEYLASGLPVVSTPSGGIEKFEGMIKTANSSSEFINMLKNILLNTQSDLIQKRRDFVKEESWKNRLETVFSLLKLE